MKHVNAKPRIVALDYGRKRIGVAVSDPLYITAQILPTLIVKNRADAVNQVQDVVLNYDSVRIVLGMPRSLSGKIGESGKEVLAFGSVLAENLQVPVEYLDEQFTSVQAENALRQMGKKPSRNKEKIDSLSAVFILQTYLDMKELSKENNE